MQLGDKVKVKVNNQWLLGVIENIYIDYETNLYVVKLEIGESITIEGQYIQEA